MAVPKKRTGHSAQGKRRANWKATKPETTVCSNCGQPVLAHTVCTACGYYKGEPVRLKDRAEAVKTVTKPAKKAKAEVSEETVETPKKTTRKRTTKKAETAEVKAEKTVEEAKAEETEKPAESAE